MNKHTRILVLAISLLPFFSRAQQIVSQQAKVDFDAYQNLVSEVKEHRKSKLLSLDDFIKASKQKDVLILDTRSDEMYANKHIKGAVHLNFSDFTQANLAKVIPALTTKILIYCNNNFDGDEVNFATKAVVPSMVTSDVKELTLALNIPTYINLYGYGYRNVFELSEFISVYDKRVEFEGKLVKKLTNKR